MSRQTISVAMIAKDEEQCIADAIKSVAPVADQIVLVDTGSSDRTVALARELGAEVSVIRSAEHDLRELWFRGGGNRQNLVDVDRLQIVRQADAHRVDVRVRVAQRRGCAPPSRGVLRVE